MKGSFENILISELPFIIYSTYNLKIIWKLWQIQNIDFFFIFPLYYIEFEKMGMNVMIFWGRNVSKTMEIS